MPNDLSIIQLAPSLLAPYQGNARTHSAKQIQQIADSIRQFGFLNPVLVDGKSRIIAGHGRVAAAKKLNLETVPVVKIDGLSEAQIKAYVIADNRLAELAGWDESILAIELQHLSSLDLDFDLSLTGFEPPKIDLLIQGLATELPLEAPRLITPGPAITRSGDLWQLGDHQLICGNALEQGTYHSLFQGEKAHMVFTDPPYNVPIAGHVSGLGKAQHTEFAMASGEMNQLQFTAFLSQFMHLAVQYSLDGSIQFICMDWRHMAEVLRAGSDNYTEFKNLCVWNKSNGGMGSLYRSKHELVFVYKNGTAAHINNIELGTHGRYRTNVWDYGGQSSLTAERQETLAMHPTVKPVQMVADAIMDCSHRGGIILDPFGGSGTTLIAAEQTGRKARLIELEPKYVDVTIRRWQQLTGRDAVYLDSGQTFGRRAAAIMEAADA